MLAIAALFLPSLASAFPFGGQASTVVPCYNLAIFARLGAPRGGDYIWTPATKTYRFGRPTSAGQWLLGLASAPYFCVVSIEPVIVWAGTAISMMGSSQPSGTVGQLLSAAPPTTAAPPVTPTYVPPTTTQQNPTSIGHVVMSEIFYNVDAAHGSATDQWIELYNGTAASVDISNWTLQNSSLQTALPSGISLASGQYLVVVSSTSTLSRWSIPSSAKTLVVSAVVGSLKSAADSLSLKQASGATVDALSWGTNTSVFNPAPASSLSGYSLARKLLTQDTDSGNDWAASSIPTPGK